MKILQALKDMFKDALQEMMNTEFDTSMGYLKYDKAVKKPIIEMSLLKEVKE